MKTNIILVDSNDNQTGEISVVNAHLGDAQRHRAITAFLRNDDDRFLMAKRSLKKPLWPTYWDAAFSTHPRVGETVEACCARRSQEELGIATQNYSDLFTYEYHLRWNIVFSEWEINHILIARFNGEPKLNPEEASDYTWMNWQEILEWSKDSQSVIAPWLTIALKQIVSDPKLLSHFR
jgi:isopentenyl-diphosphate delta-isomerase